MSKSTKKKMMTAASTFSAALGIGFVMQYGDAVASRLSPQESADATVPAVVALPTEVNVATLASAPAEVIADPVMPIPIRVAAVEDLPEEIAAPRFDVPSLSEPVDCTIDLVASASATAMVGLALNAPCHANASVVIHHQGMMFTLATDEAGVASAVVPALAQEAFFIAAFDDGAGAAALTDVPDLINFDRAVLQWQGQGDVQLHALEFGAGYESDGHIWAATMGDVDRAVDGQGGFLTRLGNPALDNALMAEVYTYPSGMSARDGNVALSVEAEVTAANCGREVAAQSIQISPRAEADAIDLTMTMPDCDAIGEFLVLKNMFRDLTLAAR